MRISAALLFLLAGCAGAPSTAARRADADFARATPESQGLSSAAVLGFVEAAGKIDSLHSLMIVRRGKVVAEGWWAPYSADANHELYSLSKSFASTAVGFAVAEGKLSLDDEILKLFPEDAPAEPSANLKAMRIRDLISMSAGHQDESPLAADKMTTKGFLAHPVPHKPGTHFKYNTPATFMCAAAVQKATGQTLLEYLKPRLFEPLGIAKPVWNSNVQGINLGGYGLRVRTEDIARFGQLYLQRGRWNGTQLLPEEWIDLAASRQVSNGSNPKSDWEQGYGFQFWRCRNGAYRGDGAFGQYCIVMPKQEAVIAITSGLRDMQQVLNLVWDRLLPGFKDGVLPEDPTTRKTLTERLAGLALKTPTGAPTSPVAAKRFVFPANDLGIETLSWTPETWTLSTRRNGAEQSIACGRGSWTKGRASWGTYVDEPSAACAAWSADDTLVVKLCLTETPYVVTLTLRFSGSELSLAAEQNVGFGGTRKVSIAGKAN